MGDAWMFRILLTNDDGIFAEGIAALANELTRSGHEVFVVAPDTQRSGAAHSFTMNMPLRCAEKAVGFEAAKAYAVSGTPVDCVKLAIGNLGIKPDLVISGINLGENRGTDIFYSGTVAAAIEGALNRLPSMAVSNLRFRPENMADSAKIAACFVNCYNKCGLPSNLLININIPDLPADKIKGVRITELSEQRYEMEYTERLDTHNTPYYWVPAGKLTECCDTDDNDERWGNCGYVTVTPLKTDLTDRARMNELKTLFEGER